MQTNIVLNEKLLEEAFSYADVSNVHELIDLALREFITNHKSVINKQLQSKVQLSAAYNYKALRKNRNF